MEYVALDLETTGLDPERDRVIEVGAVAFDPTRVVSTLERLADPGRSVPEAVLKLTGIQDVPRSTAVMQGYDRMTKAFPSTGTEHVVVVKAQPSQQPAVQKALADLSARTATDPLFAHDQDLVGALAMFWEAEAEG